MRNITVSDAEVDAQLDQDLKAFQPTISKDDFVNKILKRYNKSLYEWKEDVIRPKLQAPLPFHIGVTAQWTTYLKYWADSPSAISLSASPSTGWHGTSAG